MDIKQFNHLWNHYLSLEKMFISTFPYVSPYKDNFTSYSDQYIILLQGICSEIDNVFKSFILQINPLEKNVKNYSIKNYFKFIKLNYKKFSSEKIWFKYSDIILDPWNLWENLNNDALEHVSVSPEWWNAYNSTKHDRYNANKVWNLKNVLSSISALFILEMFLYSEILKTKQNGNDSYYINQSSLFIIESSCPTHSPDLIKCYNFNGIELKFFII